MRVPATIAPLFEAGNVGWTMLGLAVLLLAITLAILARLRWIQSRPLAACVVLSVAAHGLLISAVHLTKVFDAVPPPGDAGIAVRLSDEVAPAARQVEPSDAKVVDDETPPLPWEKLAAEPPPRPSMTPVPKMMAAEEKQPAPSEEASDLPELKLPPPVARPPAKLEKLAKVEELPMTAPPALVGKGDENRSLILDPPPLPEPAAVAPVAETPAAIAAADNQPAENLGNESPTWRHTEAPSEQTEQTERQTVATQTDNAQRRLSPRYQSRTAPDREERIRKRGGNAETEAAVQRALAWLVENQAADGRWDASDHGAGKGQLVEGRFRGAAGVQADTGITGLALLALLGSGHTHEQGKYEDAVGRGLTFLLRQQAPDGNLAGEATNFARMYCHGIASLAVCEAYAMTNDERLRPYTRRAVGYTLNAQHRTTGGWRYHPGDPGDTSQFGWQVMVLAAADEAGLHVPLQTRQGMRRFLRSVSSGTHRGLASYRVGHVASQSMTAEALACRAFLGEDDVKTTAEASRFLIREKPGSVGSMGSGQDDLYRWYYATLGMYLSDAEDWTEWNAALTRKLLRTQEVSGWQSGSWNPTTKWAGHGGRVYSTALSAMCLEVYYRYAK